MPWQHIQKKKKKKKKTLGKITYCLWANRTGTLVATATYTKTKTKIFFSETTGPTALIFGMWQWLMVFYIYYANHAPGVKFGHAPGLDCIYRLTVGKHSNISISKASRQILIKLHTQHHWAVGKITYCFWTDRTGTLVAMTTNTKENQKSFSLKPKGPQL